MSSEQPEAPTPSRPRRGSHGRGLTSSIRPVRAVIGLLAVTATYYAIPLDTDRDLVGRIIAALLGLAVVGAVIIRHLRRGAVPARGAGPATSPGCVHSRAAGASARFDK
ncbi:MULTISPECIES: hypothetical protein [Kocuria]|uniref:hypothetical protein n=1 Tax=Kocuria TaxID=57493 RepID=UPI0008A1AFBA|nr:MULTISPECIES: hypothetical protein [Kocuria]OFK06358.1 hypothetical protein HMPREF2833_05430 [Kocuria sp. HMSC066H03]PKZ38453.1 hypothetical protein CYJ75_04720 [Kocuria rhizophila]